MDRGHFCDQKNIYPIKPQSQKQQNYLTEITIAIYRDWLTLKRPDNEKSNLHFTHLFHSDNKLQQRLSTPSPDR